MGLALLPRGFCGADPASWSCSGGLYGGLYGASPTAEGRGSSRQPPLAVCVAQNSVTRSAPVNSDSQGRCGARFLTTYDRRFVIKAVSSEDVAEMHNILKKYHQFLYQGSTVSREASDKEKAKDLPTFKDNDFLNEGQKLHVGEDSKKNFLEKLKRDVEFLAQLKIMDYSLLVGIHDVDRAEQEEMEVEERAEDEECENDGLGGNPISSYGTPPDSPGNLLNYPRFFGPGEFDPSVDVYAMKSHESEWGRLWGRDGGQGRCAGRCEGVVGSFEGAELEGK
ncbi:phosphatidylinositol 5-phosphate 4-kinase type-2 beta [Parus major]|uniref:phosphatidylinositol 5-phosphate 4-kinase type-2 beta n=1 Tax=Parus major TaxID=9157 RepID=UPI0014442665|nr:phosphatidylinositol 5-phosphate 4-kinase type-2 beta [Parus major]